MMMTSGSTTHYKNMFDAASQIVAKEGTKSLFKGAGANILRGVAGAGVLSLYDKLQEVMFGKVYSGGTLFLLRSVLEYICLLSCYRIWLSVDCFVDLFFTSILVVLSISPLRLSTIDSVVDCLSSVYLVTGIPPYKYTYSRFGIKAILTEIPIVMCDTRMRGLYL